MWRINKRIFKNMANVIDGLNLFLKILKRELVLDSHPQSPFLMLRTKPIQIYLKTYLFLLLSLPSSYLSRRLAPVSETGKWSAPPSLQGRPVCPSITAPWAASTAWCQSWGRDTQRSAGRGLWMLWSLWGRSIMASSAVCRSGPSETWHQSSWPHSTVMWKHFFKCL